MKYFSDSLNRTLGVQSIDANPTAIYYPTNLPHLLSLSLIHI